MNTPKFSIIIPAYNEEVHLPKLLTSLSNQTKKDFEVIVSDAGSRDKTVSVAETFRSQFEQFTIIKSKHTKDSGPSRERNSGAMVAGGDWLVFIDADYEVLPYFIERLSWYVDCNSPGIFTVWHLPDEDTVSTGMFTLLINMFMEMSIVAKRAISYGGMTIIKRTAFEVIGGFDEKIHFGEDYEFTQRAIKHGIPFSIFREALVVISQRRMRSKGRFSFVSTYTVASLLTVFVSKKYFRYLPGYTLGGHIYKKEKQSKSFTQLVSLQKAVKDMVREFLK